MDPVVKHPWTDGNIPVMFIVSGQHPEHAFHILPRYFTKGIGTGKNLHRFFQGISAANRHGNQMLG